MYAFKGGWIGQTFALATSNESGGRKARIRRSKEERKAMVESFIKTYQTSNDGKFPSLNLTHKEVGGSFYTVREIVRDVIQENRVLGPAKFSSEKQKSDDYARELPLETSAIESQDYLFQLEIENPADVDQRAGSIMELSVNGNEQNAEHEAADACETEESDELVYLDSLVTETLGNSREPELVDANTDYHGNMSMELEFEGNEQLDKYEDLEAEQLVNVTSVEEYHEVSDSSEVVKEAELRERDWPENDQIEESDIVHHLELSPIGKHEVIRNPVLVEANTVKLSNPTEDIAVETFPMPPVTKDICTMEVKLDDSRDLIGNMEKSDSKNVSSDNGKSDNASEPVAQKEVIDPEASLSNGKPGTVRETTENDGSNLMKAEDASVKGETDEVGAQDYSKPVKATGFYASSSSMETAGKQVMVDSASGVQKESKQSLDRLNLESWQGKGASKKLSEHATNPLMVFLKSLVSAFMKILSE